MAYVGSNPFTYQEKAVFTDAVFHLTDRWSLQAGVRYAENDQTADSSTTIDGPAQGAFGPSTTLPRAHSSDDSFTWELSPTYRFNDDLMGYLRIATGYRPGGPNTVIGSIPARYDHDTVVNYELGLKGVLADNTVSFDVAAFLIDWSDIQLQNTDSATQFTYYTNGGNARSQGLEGTVEWRPLDGFSITANVTFLDASLEDALPTFTDADSLIGNSGDQLPGSPEFSGNLGVQQDFHLTSGLDGYVGANWSYVGERKADFLNSASTVPRFELPDYSQVDLRAGVATTSGWHLDAYIRNVLDEEGVVYANNRNGTGATSTYFTQPITYGLSVSKDF